MPPGAAAERLVLGPLIAQFCFHYPGVPYVSSCWPTRDHVIPWGRFWALYLELPELIRSRGW